MLSHILHLLPRPGSLLARAGALGVSALVAGLSLMPNLSVPDVAPGRTDLLIHLVMQGTLGFTLLWAWPVRPRMMACALAVLVVGLEAGQIWVPGRAFSGSDLMSNAVGAGLGALVAWYARK